MAKHKKPKNKAIPKHSRTPISNPISTENLPIRWSFSRLDSGGEWSFLNICKNTLHQLITKKFGEIEGLKWGQLKANGSHHVETYKLIKSAQERLLHLKMEDYDQLFSLRLSGKERVWGIKEGQIFFILWWDPHHAICISNKKHT